MTLFNKELEFLDNLYISCEGSNDDGLSKKRYVVAGSLAIRLTQLQGSPSEHWGEITLLVLPFFPGPTSENNHHDFRSPKP